MKLPFYIARRYLFSKKSSNAINIITWVSIIGIGVGTAALILVLSVFNGLTGFIEGLFSAMDPDIKVVAARGQTFEFSEEVYTYLSGHPEIEVATRTLESRVFLEYVDNQTFATLKGVEQNFIQVNPLDTFVYEGEYTFAPKGGVNQAVLGSAVAASLSANLENEIRPIEVFFIPLNASLANPQTAVNSGFLFPSGYFSIQKEYDEKFIITDLAFVQELFKTENKLSAYEIKLRNVSRVDDVKEELQAALGEDYEVLTWYEQHKTLYRVMKNEKYISYLILVLMLSISAVNIVGSLSMIVLEKTRDIAVLKSMGATQQLVRRIFLADGLLVGAIGGGMGLLISFLSGLAQKQFGIIQLQGGESFRVKAFPIEMEWGDFALVFVTVMILAIVASVYPSRQAGKVKVVEGLRN